MHSTGTGASASIGTPDRRLRVFVSSTLGEMAEERAAVRSAIEQLRLTPVMFELGARPHPPRELYRAYLAQSDVFVGIYGEHYGWVAPGESVSGLEDEYRLSPELPRLLYLRRPANREPRLDALVARFRGEDRVSYRHFATADELASLVADDLAVLLTERFTDPSTGEGHGPTPARPPTVLTPTRGRDDDVAGVLGLLDHRRLVTLVGPGGVGKTRLALEVAGRLVAVGRQVVHVPLATTTEPDDVGRRVAEHLGLRSEGTRPTRDTLVDALADRDLVLVLDNMEQVVAAGPELGEVLRHCPGVRMLVTSRQPLQVAGERVVRVRPLGVGDEAGTAASGGTDGVALAPAVQLFVDRVRDAGGEVDDEELPAVAELVRRLDGLPLAIELAAGWARILSPTDIAARIADGAAPTDTTGARPDRHRTVTATLEWSHDLLDEDERAVFADLGVFVGGADLSAIEAVVPAVGERIDLLSALLDKSLVETDTDVATSGGGPRFRMLETVGGFAREQLAASGRGVDVRRRHLDWVADLGRRAQPSLCGPDQRRWVARLDPDRANLRAAISHGLAVGDLSVTLRLVWDTFVYFYVRDRFVEPTTWVSALVDLAEQAPALDLVEQALLDTARVIVGAREAELLPRLATARQVFADAGMDLEEAVALHQAGLMRWEQGTVDMAVARLLAASHRYESIEHGWGVATVECALGSVLHATHPALAADHLERGLDHARRIANLSLEVQALQGLALVAALEGDAAEGRRRLVDAVDLVAGERYLTGASYCLDALAALLWQAAAPRDTELVTLAARALLSATALRDRLGVPAWTAVGDVVAPVTARIRTSMPAEAWDDLREGVVGLDPLALLTGGLERLPPG